MKKWVHGVIGIMMLFLVTGCQSASTLTAEEVVQAFMDDYLLVNFEEDESNLDLREEVLEEVEDYFTKEGYRAFAEHEYENVPIQLVNKYRTDIMSYEMTLNESALKEDSVLYEVEVLIQMPLEISSLTLAINLCEERGTWKIDAFAIHTIDGQIYQN